MPHKNLIDQKNYYKNNREQILERHRRYYQNNKEEIRKKTGGYYSENQEIRSLKMKEWRKDNPLKAAELRKQWRKNNPIKYWTMTSRQRHRRSGFKINVSTLELFSLAEKTSRCNYCGCQLDYSVFKGKSKSNSPSVDRINNELILRLDNIQIICRRCNVTKQNRTHNEFIEYCRNVSGKFGEMR